MKNIIVICFASVFVLLTAVPGFSQSVRGGFFDFPVPMLFKPTEKADLTGKDSLKFTWNAADTASTDHFEFRLYKGHIPASDYLVYKEDVDSNASYTDVKADLFEDGQAYTWQLRAISNAGYKSDWAHNTFTAIKK